MVVLSLSCGTGAPFRASLGGCDLLPPFLAPLPPLPPVRRVGGLSVGGRIPFGTAGPPAWRGCRGSVGGLSTWLTGIAPLGAWMPASATSHRRALALFADMAAKTPAAEAVSSCPPGGACVATVGYRGASESTTWSRRLAIRTTRAVGGRGAGWLRG